MKKRGISAVIASVLIILITIAAISIIWIAVVPMIEKIVDINEPVSLEIVQEGYTSWDPMNRLAEIQVTRGTDKAEIEGFDFVFVLDGNSMTYPVRREIGLNSKNVYYFNFSGIDGNLEMVKIIPVYEGGKKGDVVSILKINSFANKDLSGTGKTFVNPKDGTTTGGGNPIVGCTDTCVSLGFECGMQTVCGASKDCGGCSSGKSCNLTTQKCENNPIIVSPYCGDTICNNGESCSTCDTDCGVCPTNDECINDNDCYYVSVSGAGNHNGSLGNEMNLSEAINHANIEIDKKITLRLESGNYPYLNINNLNERSSWTNKILFRPAEGHLPVIDGMKIFNSNNSYLEFENLTFYRSIPETSEVILVHGGTHIRFKKCLIRGLWDGDYYTAWRTTQSGIATAYYSGYIDVEDCEFTELQEGIADSLRGYAAGPVVFKGNYVHKFYRSGISQGSYFPENTQYIIVDNVISDSYSGAYKSGAHMHGSGIVIRNGDVIIKGNKISAGGGSGYVRFYENSTKNGATMPGGYSNVIFENNVIYANNGSTLVYMAFMGNNVSIRNNSIIGRWNKKYTIRDYLGSTITLGFDPTSNREDFFVENNIFLSYVTIRGDFLNNATVKNNLYWASNYNGDYQTVAPGTNSYQVARSTQSASCQTPFYVTYFEEPGIFFLGGVDFLNAYSTEPPLPEPEVFNLMINSIACNGTMGQKGVAFAGALPCVCTNNVQCQEVFGTSSACNLITNKCE